MEEGLEEDYLMENITEGVSGEEASYLGEYQEIISVLARLCSIISHNERQMIKEKKVKIEEGEILEVCSRIGQIVSDYDKQP